MSKVDFWAGHLAAIEREGLSVKAYAERESVSAASLYQWRNKSPLQNPAKKGSQKRVTKEGSGLVFCLCSIYISMTCRQFIEVRDVQTFADRV